MPATVRIREHDVNTFPTMPTGHGKVKVLTTHSLAGIVDDVNASEALRLVEARRLAASGEGKSIREAAGLSIHETADVLGLSVSALFRWENGERVPRGDRAVAWADFLEQLGATRRPA